MFRSEKENTIVKFLKNSETDFQPAMQRRTWHGGVARVATKGPYCPQREDLLRTLEAGRLAAADVTLTRPPVALQRNTQKKAL